MVESGNTFTMRFKAESKDGGKKRPQKPLPRQDSEQITDIGLFEELRAWRRDMASKRGVPAYTVCTDSVLRRIVAYKPRTMSQLDLINGVGDAFLNRYGSQVLGIIAKHDK